MVALGFWMLSIVSLLGILVHELGHAALALRFTDGPVHVLVGRHDGALQRRFGRLRVSLHWRRARGVAWTGLCVFKRTGDLRQELWIAAAGPLAGACWAIACAVTIVFAGGRLGLPVELGIALGALGSVLESLHVVACICSRHVADWRPTSDGAEIRSLRAALAQGVRRVAVAPAAPATSVAPPGGNG